MFKRYLEACRIRKELQSNKTDTCSAGTLNEIIHFKSNDQNPISALNELKLNEKYEIAGIKGPQHQLVFTYRVKVAGKCFYGTGSTKKDAKTATAREALRHLDNFIGKSDNFRPVNGVILSRSAEPSTSHEIPNTFATIKASRIMLINRIKEKENQSFQLDSDCEGVLKDS